jgi:pimeloyl-ACP methyl ester carboxylesterase
VTACGRLGLRHHQTIVSVRYATIANADGLAVLPVLNWYRNLDRMWELTRCLCGAQLRQPALFIAGAMDAVITMYRSAFDTLEDTVPNLRRKVLLPGAGHWIQQERSVEVNRLLVEFLASF